MILTKFPKKNAAKLKITKKENFEWKNKLLPCLSYLQQSFTFFYDSVVVVV